MAVEMLATSRDKRANAGAKMAKLLQQTDDCDDFYKGTYGGFFEEDNDDAFSSPAESESDVSFESEEGASGDEAEEGEEGDDEPRRKRRVVTKAYKEPKHKTGEGSKAKHFFKQKQPRERRIHKGMKYYKLYSQKERLHIAKKTEIENLKSLENFLKFELEKKQKAKTHKRKDLSGTSYIRYHSTSMPVVKSEPGQLSMKPEPDLLPAEAGPSNQDDLPPGDRVSRTFVTFSDLDTYNSSCQFTAKSPSRQRHHKYCVVTGLYAKYVCPQTGLPYANLAAYKVIQKAIAARQSGGVHGFICAPEVKMEM